jgi:hypothetical protein
LQTTLPACRSKRLEHGDEKAKKLLARLRGGQQQLARFREIIQRDTGLITGDQIELRANQLTGIQIYQFMAFPLEVSHAHVR